LSLLTYVITRISAAIKSFNGQPKEAAERLMEIAFGIRCDESDIAAAYPSASVGVPVGLR